MIEIYDIQWQTMMVDGSPRRLLIGVDGLRVLMMVDERLW